MTLFISGSKPRGILGSHELKPGVPHILRTHETSKGVGEYLYDKVRMLQTKKSLGNTALY